MSLGHCCQYVPGEDVQSTLSCPAPRPGDREGHRESCSQEKGVKASRGEPQAPSSQPSLRGGFINLDFLPWLVAWRPRMLGARAGALGPTHAS